MREGLQQMRSPITLMHAGLLLVPYMIIGSGVHLLVHCSL